MQECNFAKHLPPRPRSARCIVVSEVDLGTEWDLEGHLKELSSCGVMQEEFLYNLLFLIWFLVVSIKGIKYYKKESMINNFA